MKTKVYSFTTGVTQIVTVNLAFPDKFQSLYRIIVSRISLDSNMVKPQVKNVDFSADLSTW